MAVVEEMWSAINNTTV